MSDNRDYNNYKPFRTRANKELAKKRARKNKEGHWECPDVPVHYHPVKKELLKSGRIKMVYV